MRNRTRCYFVIALNVALFESLDRLREERIYDAGDDQVKKAAFSGDQRTGLCVWIIIRLANGASNSSCRAGGTEGLLLTVRDTVAMETLAIFATSSIPIVHLSIPRNGNRTVC